MWRCFHCDEVFITEADAALHFGPRIHSEPGCTIDLAKYRKMEKRMRCAGEEDTQTDRYMYALQSRHRERLRDAEQTGYDKALDDVRKNLVGYISRDAAKHAIAAPQYVHGVLMCKPGGTTEAGDGIALYHMDL